MLPDEPIWVYTLRIATPALVLTFVMSVLGFMPLMLMGKYIQSNQQIQQQIDLARQVH